MQILHGISFMVMAAVVAAQAQNNPFTVGSLRAGPGEAVSGMLEVPAASDPGSQVPITILHGARPGPVLALVAGVHGYEYPPILALQKLRSQVDPQGLSGTLLLVHVANLPSFLGRTIYFSPIDHKNLNRVFPGKRDGTTSERIAHAITTQVIDRCDYLVDLHCGDGNESLRPYLYQPVTGRARLDAVMAEMALVWGLDHIVIERGRPTDPAASIYCSTTAVTRGKPALTVEDGYLGTSDPESIERLVRGALSLMRHLKMLEGTPQRVSSPVFLDPAQVLTSPATGTLFPRVQRGHYVAKGALVASITDFFGRQIAEVRSPFDGVVLYVVATPPISKDQPVAFIGAPRK
jgi:hypothetical protein